ncbi:UvrD-helicase domain-containing protein [Leisingera sp. S232]|uniref:UvrD-helicase domain-containing protein n=1 Tax=Leisingera sp. S232 TaxID=3415132 RepID=UPI003C7D6BE3
MVDVPHILQAHRGHVIAPAGCGKTELIAKTIAQSEGKPVLVLTHTTAGVAALRQRLQRDGVSASNYRLNTIAGWALTIISMFPERAGYLHDPKNAPDYTAVQNAVGELCASGAIHSEIAATYSRVLVDEYQDCSASQHLITSGLASAIPAIVFGDPMQAIFGFGNDPLPDWTTQVVPTFPELGRLNTPWRWNNAGANDLGGWLLTVRGALEAGHQIDLRTLPDRVAWHPLCADHNANAVAQIAVQYEIAKANPQETILIIGDSIQADSRHNFASRAKGVGVVEPVDFRDVVDFANQMDGKSGQELLVAVIGFLISVMTNVYGEKLNARVQSILGGRNRTPPTAPEVAAVSLVQGGGYAEAVNFLKAMAGDRTRRVYRQNAFNIMIEALQIAIAKQDGNLPAAIAGIREQRRHAGRVIPPKAIGSTLLLKGLEADHVVILDADRPGNAMSKEHLYVALTRGARSVSVFSRSPILPKRS